MKSILMQADHLSDGQLPQQEQSERIRFKEPLLLEEEALRAQFELEDELYQRFKLPLYDSFFDLCSK